MTTYAPEERCINFSRLRWCYNAIIRRHDLRSSAIYLYYACEEPAKPKKVKAELGGSSARAFFRIIIHQLLYYYIYITLAAHSLFSAATGPRRMALTVNRVHNNNNNNKLPPHSYSHWRSSATTGHIVEIANVSVSLSLRVVSRSISIVYTTAAVIYATIQSCHLRIKYLHPYDNNIF
jgi:hypothetical protein